MHRQVIRLMIEKGQLPPDAMDRFVTLLAEGVDSLVASRMLVEASGIMKAPAMVAPASKPVLEVEAVAPAPTFREPVRPNEPRY